MNEQHVVVHMNPDSAGAYQPLAESINRRFGDRIRASASGGLLTLVSQGVKARFAADGRCVALFVSPPPSAG